MMAPQPPQSRSSSRSPFGDVVLDRLIIPVARTDDDAWSRREVGAEPSPQDTPTAQALRCDDSTPAPSTTCASVTASCGRSCSSLTHLGPAPSGPLSRLSSVSCSDDERHSAIENRAGGCRGASGTRGNLSQSSARPSPAPGPLGQRGDVETAGPPLDAVNEHKTLVAASRP
jgi:hypothetical protein